MFTAKTHLVAASVFALIVVGGTGAIVATKLASGWNATAQAQPAPDTEPVAVPAAPAVALPTTMPTGPEILTRYTTPAGQRATFTGRVEGLVDPQDAQIGIVSLRGVQWTSGANYQWEPINPDGTFTITASTFPAANRALAVRSLTQSVTFLRTEFNANESAKDIVVRMKPSKPISIIARDSQGNVVRSFKAEIFDTSVAGPTLTDDKGRPLASQRLDAPLTSSGVIDVAVPLEPISLLVSGDRIAPCFQIIDPRTAVHFELVVRRATPISGTITENGAPVAGLRVMLHNDAVTLSYTARKTDAAGVFAVPAGIPGTYEIEVRGKIFRVHLIEGEPRHVDIDLSATDPAVPTTLPAEPTTGPAVAAQ